MTFPMPIYAPILALPGGPSFEFIDEVTQFSSGTSTTTINNVPFGDPHPDRRVLLAATIQRRVNATNLSSMSIAGEAPVIHRHETRDQGPNVRRVSAILASRIVPTGEDGTVVFNFSGSGTDNQTTIRVASFRIISSNETPFHTGGGDMGNAGLTASGSLNIPASGVMVTAAATYQANIDSHSGLGSEVAFEQLSFTHHSVIAGRVARYQENMDAQSGRTISVTGDNLDAGKVVAGLSWDMSG